MNKDSLFTRVPTNEEKTRYIELWGGITPVRCAFGMITMFLLGMLLTNAISREIDCSSIGSDIVFIQYFIVAILAFIVWIFILWRTCR